MTFKPVDLKAIDIKKEKDKAYIGYYTGSHQIDTKLGPQVVWDFIDENDGVFGIYGFTNLNLRMKTLKVGAHVRITYKGTQFAPTKFKPSGQEIHQVLLELDDEADGPAATGVAEKDVPF